MSSPVAHTATPGIHRPIILLALGLAALSCVIFLSETTEDATTASMGDTSSATELGSTGSTWMPLLANRVITITGGLEGISGRKNKFCGLDVGDGKFKCKYSDAVSESDLNHSEITRFEIFPYCPHYSKTETEALYEGPRCVPHTHNSGWPGTGRNPSMVPKDTDATSYAIRSQKNGKWCGLHAPKLNWWEKLFSTWRNKYELKCISDEVPTTGRFAFDGSDGRLVIWSNEKAWGVGSTKYLATCVDEGIHGVQCTGSQGWYDTASRDKWKAWFGIAKLYCGWPEGKVGKTAPTIASESRVCPGIPTNKRPTGDQFVSELTESRRRTRL